jgi:adenine-specific DNA-methyltransferase
MDLKKIRGQFFTTRNRVLDVLVSLIKNNGSIFEPSAGEGHIIKHVEKKLNRDVIGVELDTEKSNNKVCKSNIVNDNFFNFIKNDYKYATSIGNPPFVKLKNVESDTISVLPEKIDGNGNLYYFFIKYSITVLQDDGELIFIVPKEWLYNTSAQFLRDYLCENGDFTHFIDCGEEKLFDDADVPALCIFRYQKNFKGKVKYYESIDDYNNDKFVEKNTVYGKTVTFTNRKISGGTISDFFDVKVGLVSGLEKIYDINNVNNIEEECIIHMMTTKKEIKPYLFLENYNNFNDIPINAKNYIIPNKKKLLGRKIKKYKENNWWKYGAIRNIEIMRSNRPRIYGIMKTRDSSPFWVGVPNSYFSGGVFALFLKEGVDLDINVATNFLNSDEFKQVMKESNMFSNNKVSITPSAFSSLSFGF